MGKRTEIINSCLSIYPPFHTPSLKNHFGSYTHMSSYSHILISSYITSFHFDMAQNRRPSKKHQSPWLSCFLPWLLLLPSLLGCLVAVDRFSRLCTTGRQILYTDFMEVVSSIPHSCNLDPDTYTSSFGLERGDWGVRGGDCNGEYFSLQRRINDLFGGGGDLGLRCCE